MAEFLVSSWVFFFFLYLYLYLYLYLSYPCPRFSLHEADMFFKCNCT
jgi:hypothetical protein